MAVDRRANNDPVIGPAKVQPLARHLVTPLLDQFRLKQKVLKELLPQLPDVMIEKYLFVDFEFRWGTMGDDFQSIYEATACYFRDGKWHWLPGLRWPMQAASTPLAFLKQLFDSYNAILLEFDLTICQYGCARPDFNRLTALWAHHAEAGAVVAPLRLFEPQLAIFTKLLSTDPDDHDDVDARPFVPDRGQATIAELLGSTPGFCTRFDRRVAWPIPFRVPQFGYAGELLDQDGDGPSKAIDDVRNLAHLLLVVQKLKDTHGELELRDDVQLQLM